MKNILSTLLLFSILLNGLTAQELIQKIYGEQGSNEDRGECIIATFDGGSLVAGKAINPATQHFDAFLLKLDTNGDKIWYKTFESNRNTIVKSVVQLLDGGFVFCGEEENEANKGTGGFVWKVDTNGDIQWKHSIDNAQNEGFTQVIRLKNGSCFVAGYQNATDISYLYDSKLFWKQINENGQIELDTTFQFEGNPKPRSMVEAPDGSIRMFVSSEINYTNYILTFFLQPNIPTTINSLLLNTDFLDENAYNSSLLLADSTGTFLFTISKNSSFKITRYSQGFFPQYFFPSVQTTGEEVYTAQFIHKDTIFVKVFSPINDTITSVFNFYLNIPQTATTLHSSYTIPLKTRRFLFIVDE
jgi:hypothetical protein